MASKTAKKSSHEGEQSISGKEDRQTKLGRARAILKREFLFSKIEAGIEGANEEDALAEAILQLALIHGRKAVILATRRLPKGVL